jgi:outer membrane murein-binding lipoprotein Lpp
MNSLRSWLLTSVVSITLVLGACVGSALSARVDALDSQVQTLEKENTLRRVDSSVIQQDLKDFRRSFEEFKNDVKNDIARRRR